MKRELLIILLINEKYKNKSLILDDNLTSSLLLENLYIYLKSINNNEC